MLALAFFIIQAMQMVMTSHTIGVSIAAYIYSAVINAAWVVTGAIQNSLITWVTAILYFFASIFVILVKLWIEHRYSKVAQTNIESIRKGLQTMRFFVRHKIGSGCVLFVAKQHKEMHLHENGSLRYIFCFKDERKRVHCCYLSENVGNQIVISMARGYYPSEAYLKRLKHSCSKFETDKNLIKGLGFDGRHDGRKSTILSSSFSLFGIFSSPSREDKEEDVEKKEEQFYAKNFVHHRDDTGSTEEDAIRTGASRTTSRFDTATTTTTSSSSRIETDF